MNVTFNPLSLANAFIFIVTLVAIPATAAISSEFCSKVSFLVVTGHLLSALVNKVFLSQGTFIGSFVKLPLVAMTPFVLWHAIPDVVFKGFLFLLTVASPILLAIEAAQVTRLSIRAGSIVLDVVERHPASVSYFFVVFAAGCNLISGAILYDVFESNTIDVASASIISILATLTVILGASVVVREEGSIIEVSLIGIYLSFVCWSVMEPYHPPPAVVGVSTMVQWGVYLWSILSIGGTIRLFFRTCCLLSLSVNLHDDDEDDDNDESQDGDIVSTRGWNNGLVNALCLCLYSHAVLQLLDHHVYTVAAWGPARVFQCVVALSLYVHTIFASSSSL